MIPFFFLSFFLSFYGSSNRPLHTQDKRGTQQDNQHRGYRKKEQPIFFFFSSIIDLNFFYIYSFLAPQTPFSIRTWLYLCVLLFSLSLSAQLLYFNSFLLIFSPSPSSPLFSTELEKGWNGHLPKTQRNQTREKSFFFFLSLQLAR
ncbi:hypothetical protein F4809DRAFT_616856 [Biscogniauxia mediterranea]|nr:hypothetical protein F4809DRAFT_616856 [Biscogniauxia mediterranea]